MTVYVRFCLLLFYLVSFCQHMSAYVGMYVGICRHGRYMSAWSVYVGICRHMSAYVGFCRIVGFCRHMSAFVGTVGICRLWSAYVGLCRHMSAFVGICRLFGRHMSACRLLSAYVGFKCVFCFFVVENEFLIIIMINYNHDP